MEFGAVPMENFTFIFPSMMEIPWGMKPRDRYSAASPVNLLQELALSQENTPRIRRTRLSI